MLHERPRVVSKLDLAVGKIPDSTTVCTRMKDLEMALWYVFLRLSTDLRKPSEVQRIDATGLNRRAATDAVLDARITRSKRAKRW